MRCGGGWQNSKVVFFEKTIGFCYENKMLSRDTDNSEKLAMMSQFHIKKPGIKI